MIKNANTGSFRFLNYVFSTLFFALCSLSFAFAQLPMPNQSIDANATLIYLEHCNTLQYDQQNHPDAQLLTGDVVFRHDSALMFCDSAYFYETANSLDAFGNIRFEQGDTLFGYGDVLYYNGNTRLARMRYNVRLVHYNTVLTTDSLNYDRAADMAYYFNGGNINDSLNTLHSVWGQYLPPKKQATFKDSVLLINENFTLESDTLQYNTASHIAQIVSPTTIIYQEKTTILSDRGWYNTETEKSTLLDRSVVKHTDGKQLTGDSILYDKREGIGRIYYNMELTDTVNLVTLYGNYGEYHEETETGYATDSALAIDRSDSLWLYIHADTLFTEPDKKTITTIVKHDSIMIDSVMTAQSPDTIQRDTSFQRMRGFRSVRVYREDMQAVCDSMAYSGKDTLMRFYYNPIVWNDTSQLSADSIIVQMNNGEVDHANCYGSAMVIRQQSDTNYYDQLSGKEIIAWVKDGELHIIDVKGNAETVFFPHEKDEERQQDKKTTTNESKGEIVGVNMTKSSFVKMYLKDGDVERVLFTTATTGTMYPLEDLTYDQMKLSGFFWAIQERPTSPEDVFRKAASTPRPTIKAMSASSSDTNNGPISDTNTATPASRPSGKTRQAVR